jgi:hypothetical protein
MSLWDMGIFDDLAQNVFYFLNGGIKNSLDDHYGQMAQMNRAQAHFERQLYSDEDIARIQKEWAKRQEYESREQKERTIEGEYEVIEEKAETKSLPIIQD